MRNNSAPTDPLQAFLAEIAEMRGRIADLERAAQRTAAKGIIASKEASASTYTTASTTETDITASTGDAPSITAALDPYRRYRAVFNGRFQSTVDLDVVLVRFVENGTNRRLTDVTVRSATNVTVHHEWVFTPASASAVVYKVVAARIAGTGTISAVATSITTLDFYIEDIGSL